jgi:tRNA pseudouridine38/39 synthase
MRGAVDRLWSVWRQRKIDEFLAGALLDLTVSQGDQSAAQNTGGESLNHGVSKKSNKGAKIWVGGNETRPHGKYVPVNEKGKMDTVEVQNARGLVSKQRKLANKEEAAAKLAQV